MEEKKPTIKEKKFEDKGELIKFREVENHYELIFMDDFNYPSAENQNPKNVISEVVLKMREANHDKEIHVFVASFGGEVHALTMIFQELLRFKWRVAVNMGYADSCGWMLMFACQERYITEYGEMMYHDMSSFTGGKITELKNELECRKKWWASIQNCTDTKKVLTVEELKLGETSEVWLLGAELIKRGACMPYEMYFKRPEFKTSSDSIVEFNDKKYLKMSEEYVEIELKELSDRISYEDLRKSTINAQTSPSDSSTSKKKRKKN